MRIGLISDTHGLLRPQVFDIFQGVDRILHAGDIGAPDLLLELQAIAPVTAVWGNTDGFAIRARTEPIEHLEVSGLRIVLLHGHQHGSPTPESLRRACPASDIIVYGHTHRPRVDLSGASLVVNPGAAGAARFGIPPSVAILTIDGEPRVDLIELDQ
jgi:uncharacterized protein